MTPMAQLIKKDSKGTIKIPMDWVELEMIEEQTKHRVIASYVLKDRSYIKILFTKKEDYILEIK